MNPYSERPKTNYSLPVALTMSLACILLMVRTGQEVEDKRSAESGQLPESTPSDPSSPSPEVPEA